MPHRVDITAILAYIAGLGSIAASITIDPNGVHAHLIKSVVGDVGTASLLAGLALRTFWNQTPPGNPPSNTQGGSFTVTSNPTTPTLIP